MPRTALALGAIVALAFGLTACVAEPEPEPEWTEETAYAEAEEVFRAYHVASSFGSEQDVTEFVGGDLLAHYAEGDSALEGLDIEARGESVVTTFTPGEYRTVGEEIAVEAVACIDDSTLELNIDGAGWATPREDPTYGVHLRFATQGESLVITNLVEGADDEC
ncbi:MAG: hypothetical protein ACTH32_00370 [Microbacterium gubbeenense]|uniref:hypothetical protein n=2 Tax=Microbacterium gubbeenense TaxID=159896 RepID=UPI0003FB8459|nr:hypothetical protein [Microbacterium gubbeenense]